jgi:hypothetical protein
MRRFVTPLEVFGLRPVLPALSQCAAAVLGDGYAPPSQWDRTSLGCLKPRVALPLWLGRHWRRRRAVIYQLPNRKPAPRHAAYSVRITFAEDFRGLRLTYDGHVGTDFAVPVGTEVVATAPGIVREIRKDMQRGGLKVCIEHGAGLVTMSNHLSRALVTVGQRVERGEVVALSGMSGVDGILFFPWLAPHVHFNVLLNGEVVDPFARPGEEPIWRAGLPEPHRGEVEDDVEPTRWSESGVAAAIAACRDRDLRARLESVTDRGERAVRVATSRVLTAHRFEQFPALVDQPHPRRRHLDLPFAASDYDGAVFADQRA